jgi:hypothetical protein
MCTNATDAVEGTDLEPRDVRALTEYLTVLDDYGRARDADGLYVVVSESGNEYLVDAETDTCECKDYEHNLPTEDGRERCKHRSRVAFATGERSIPAWIDTDAVDAQLGIHVDETPRVAATDGGRTLAPEVAEQVTADERAARAGRDAVDEDTDDRPDDCDCGAWNAGEELACWPCYREGFETPADVKE